MERTEDEAVLIDTNIIVYAYAASEEDVAPEGRAGLEAKIQKSRKLLRSALNGEFRACVGAQKIAEFYSVATSQVAKPLATATAAGIARSLARSTILETVYETDESFREIFVWMEAGRRDPEGGPWLHDCCLAFAAKAKGIRTILTENVDDFSDFEFIDAANPLAEKPVGSSA